MQASSRVCGAGRDGKSARPPEEGGGGGARLTTEDPAPRRIFSRAERSCRPTWVTPMGHAALPTDTPM